VTPTSAIVIVNPSQIELLRADADHLRAKAENLSQRLRSGHMVADQELLLENVKEAMGDLDKTEAAYKEREDKGAEPSYTQAVNVFFDDIRFEYGDALKSLKRNPALLHQTGPRPVLASSRIGGSPPRLNRASEAVLKSIMHNAKAYDVMASSGKTTFDLEVSSEPTGATVSYRQRIDPEYKTLDHQTDWRIPNLYHATYLIRFQKSDCEEQVITFQGGESTSTSVHASLVCKGRAR
jgi:hypothetical protein